MTNHPSSVGTATGLLAQAAGYAHSLADLQLEAQERCHMTPAQTLAAAAGLYERGLITYPVTEDRFLPLNFFDDAARIVRGYALASGSRAYDPTYKAPCWVDELRGSHAGITLTNAPAGSLFGVAMTDPETRIYRLIHARFLTLFERPAG